MRNIMMVWITRGEGGIDVAMSPLDCHWVATMWQLCGNSTCSYYVLAMPHALTLLKSFLSRALPSSSTASTSVKYCLPW